VIITNQDCNLAADRLGLRNYTFIPHVVDETMFRPKDSALREQLLAEHHCTSIVVAPARHHWKHAPAGLANSWFKRNDIAIRGLARLMASKPHLRPLVVFFEWGQEVDLSKALIRECGLEARVRWEPIVSKPAMAEFYNAADLVLDQFNDIGAFGTVVPEALASGKPVMLNFHRERHVWCYGEPPPCIDARTEEDVAARVAAVLEDDGYRQELGERGHQWFLDKHSTAVVARRHIDVYSEVAERFGWSWVH
jgi:glycosyltransferase involved in cell wall biosynthesis